MRILSGLLVVLFLVSVASANHCHSQSTSMKHEDHSKMKMTMPLTKAVEVTTKVKCPVTGTMIVPAKAFSKTTYKGKTYYFCCADCAVKFKKNPGKYQ